ncbi:MAG: hypothetical protein JW892_15955 [Anaerolineae bacterium]|nr:hypothetical protein [Anaerolineae bacterium]
MRNKITYILAGLAMLVLIGALAAAGGALARLVSDRFLQADPTQDAEPTAPAIATNTAAAPPPTPSPRITEEDTTPTIVQATPRPTSTPKPAPTPTATPEYETVLQGEGVLMVCRRHCPGITEPQAQTCAEEVKRLNGLWGDNPQLIVGKKLRMPPCPEVE